MDQIKTGNPPTILDSRNLHSQLGRAFTEVWKLLNRFSEVISNKVYSKQEVEDLIDKKIKSMRVLHLIPSSKPTLITQGHVVIYCDLDDGCALKAVDWEGTVLRVVTQGEEAA